MRRLAPARVGVPVRGVVVVVVVVVVVMTVVAQMSGGWTTTTQRRLPTSARVEPLMQREPMMHAMVDLEAIVPLTRTVKPTAAPTTPTLSREEETVLPRSQTRVLPPSTYFPDNPASTPFRSNLEFVGKDPPENLQAHLVTLIEEWWDLVGTPRLARLSQTQTQTQTQGKPPLVVAYCKFDQASDLSYPERQNEWLMWWLIGKHAFPDRETIFAPCLPSPRTLPRDVDPASDRGLRLLGLVQTDIRYCQWGSSDIVALQRKRGFIDGIVEISPAWKRAGIAATDVDASAETIAKKHMHVTTHQGRVGWPLSKGVWMLHTPDGQTPVRPLLIRENVEPWAQSVSGVALQLEAKMNTNEYPIDGVGLFQPHLVNSLGRRLDKNKEQRVLSEWTATNQGHNGPFVSTVLRVVTRPAGFNAAAERAAKKHFAAYLNSHCRTYTGSHLTSVVVRDLFAFTLATVAAKPVKAMASCPTWGTARLGMTEDARAMLVAGYHGVGAVHIYADHKFALVMENTRSLGYFSEKLVNAYQARSVPVYFGPDAGAFKQHVNPDAVIFCELPEEWTDENRVVAFRKKLCRDTFGPSVDLKLSRACEDLFRAKLEANLAPHLSVCASRVRAVDADPALYDRILSAPLAPTVRRHRDHEAGDAQLELGGVWNHTRSGELLRVVVAALGVLSPPR